MNVLPPQRMTVDEYLRWAELQPGKYELHAGAVYAMTPERAGHARTKYRVQAALEVAIERARLNCKMLPDGMTVRIDRDTAYEPDALVYCGDDVPDASVEVPNPMIVIEVLSHSSRRIDTSQKLEGYFRVVSIIHYLIVDPERTFVIHHARQQDGTIATRVLHDGAISLDPPGLSIALADIYRAPTG